MRHLVYSSLDHKLGRVIDRRLIYESDQKCSEISQKRTC
ncbi:unnamed protein product [Acanthoscelides obtectus]|uniref:Uncharacterized protein n=1 Tax=Acanthoscelides obtectus TaxID=200917 RepID=A0A9P0QF07_ACAOB|nr:unnamed protein product [Acanthoscelides obtectus]CAH2018666.1 unnamed protein product [Acanthoscelides obtectus]CAK1685496.1 hypothetical protein AOBTE_LOCUS35456 [Acanthoscelides obtectus]CAK1688493.1 hypothetical protein AOBTE_LOCUS36737 [Acanthoscelides obtectus]